MTDESWDEPDPALAQGGVIDQPAEEPAVGAVGVGGVLLALPGVEGVGVTTGPDGGEAIVVYVRDASVASTVPPTVGELPTHVEITGQINALPEGDSI